MLVSSERKAVDKSLWQTGSKKYAGPNAFNYDFDVSSLRKESLNIEPIILCMHPMGITGTSGVLARYEGLLIIVSGCKIASLNTNALNCTK